MKRFNESNAQDLEVISPGGLFSDGTFVSRHAFLGEELLVEITTEWIYWAISLVNFALGKVKVNRKVKPLFYFHLPETLE